MMTYDIQDRIHAAAALKHPWFEKASDSIINLEKLSSFNAKEKLKQSLIGYFGAHMMAESTYEKFVDHFQALDKDRLGYMYMNDFMKAY